MSSMKERWWWFFCFFFGVNFLIIEENALETEMIKVGIWFILVRCLVPEVKDIQGNWLIM